MAAESKDVRFAGSQRSRNLHMGPTVAAASNEEIQEYRSARTRSVGSDGTARSETWPASKPTSLLATAPGIYALGFFLAFYIPAIALNWWLGNTKDMLVADMDHMPLENFLEMAGLCVFLLFIILDFASTSMQVSPKKRQLSSIILFINSVCACVYFTHVFHLAPKIVDIYGEDITDYSMHIFEWAFTTPCMIIVIDSLATPLKSTVVSDWKIVGRLLFIDEAMLLLGFVSLYCPSGYVMVASFAASSICYLFVCYGIHQEVEVSIAKTATSFEAASIRYLEISTYLLWTVFPVLHVAQIMGYITPQQHALGRILCDVVAKTVYSVSLLSGNFCLLDTIAELRVLQMKETQAAKASKILKVEKMNEALQMAVIEAETSSRLSRKFIANVSHELRTPLNSVINFTSLLMDTELEETQQEYVSSTLTSAQALLGVINQVLDFSKLDNGDADSIHLEMQPFYFATLCEEVEDIIAARISENNVDFKVSCPIKGPCLVGDCFRIRQCLINLSDNAVKFANPEGGEVNLSVKCEPDEDADFMKVRIEVNDNGHGIPAEKQSLLFKPFSQVESSYARQHQGTGLGLAITKKIVEAMNGTIVCSSKEGQGTTFRTEFILSICNEHDALPAPKHALTPLVGEVCMCMKPSLSAQMIKENCLAFGMKWTDQSSNLDDIDRIVAQFVHSTRENKQKVLFIDYDVFLNIHKRCPDLDNGKILVVGKHSFQMGAIGRGEVDAQGFVAMPVKPSVLFSRIQGRLAALLGKVPKMRPLDEPALGPLSPYSCDKSRSITDMPLRDSVASTKATRDVNVASEGPSEKKPIIRVLIVEDQPVNQKVAIAMVTKIYGKDGVVFEKANHGLEGLGMATKGHDFDLILMDCQMPFMDGLECTRKIREWEQEQGREGIAYCPQP